MVIQDLVRIVSRITQDSSMDDGRNLQASFQDLVSKSGMNLARTAERLLTESCKVLCKILARIFNRALIFSVSLKQTVNHNGTVMIVWRPAHSL